MTSSDPSGLYDYQYRWYIGSTAEVGSPQKVMAYFQQHAQDIFPFYLGGCDALSAGTTCSLRPIPLAPWMVAPVRVTQLGATSFTFTALPGHFDQPGSTIRFTVLQQDCGIYLEQTAHGTTNPLADLVAPFVAADTWAQQAENLRMAVVPGYLPLPFTD